MANPCNSFSPLAQLYSSSVSGSCYAHPVRISGPLSPPSRCAKRSSVRQPEQSSAVPRFVVMNMSPHASGYRPSDAATLYGVLGVDQNVSVSEIKSAYRQLVRRYHPDVFSGSDKENPTEMFLRIQEAYEVLIDPYRRADYDYNILHPFCAQALEKESSDKPWMYRRRQHGQVQHEVSTAWKLQWVAQLNRLKQRQSYSRSNTESWGARMRRSNAHREEPAYSASNGVK